ncbi:MAG: type II toxin-antitoxin system PemK/MazF family toxin [Gemmatimonadota bacterium]
MRFQRGTIVLVDLDPTRGHEQKGLRPAAIVSDPDVTEDQRFPMLCIVPITGTSGGEGALYPPLQSGASGLRKRSFALLDQIRSVDKRRVRRVFGHVTPAELEAIDGGLRLFLGLPESRSRAPSAVRTD